MTEANTLIISKREKNKKQHEASLEPGMLTKPQASVRARTSVSLLSRGTQQPGSPSSLLRAVQGRAGDTGERLRTDAEAGTEGG